MEKDCDALSWVGKNQFMPSNVYIKGSYVHAMSFLSVFILSYFIKDRTC